MHGSRNSVLLAALLLFLVMSGLNGQGHALEIATGDAGLRASIALSSKSSHYDISDVRAGAVVFLALIENRGDSPLTVAHPFICVPADYQAGSLMRFEDYHGKSEILLSIEKDDGRTFILRDGPHFFDPGGRSHFTLQPGASQEFDVGWFFQNARGRWEDDALAETVFTEKGRYRVRLLFRNIFPRAIVRDPATGKSDMIEAWTGEMQSNEVTIEVK